MKTDQDQSALINSIQQVIAERIKAKVEEKNLSGAVAVLGVTPANGVDDSFNSMNPTIMMIGSKFLCLELDRFNQKSTNLLLVAMKAMTKMIRDSFAGQAGLSTKMDKPEENIPAGVAKYSKYGIQFLIALATNAEDDKELEIIIEVLKYEGTMEF